MDSAVLFDFGGTLDADGLTWKERFHRLFEAEGVAVEPARFDPVFYAADDALVGAVPETFSLQETVHRVAGGVASGASTRRRGARLARGGSASSPTPGPASRRTRPSWSGSPAATVSASCPTSMAISRRYAIMRRFGGTLASS